MALKVHKNLVANDAAATRLTCWRRGDFVCFGLVNPDTPDTLAASKMPGETLIDRDLQRSSIERQFGTYLFRHQ
jgi:hypothetical protein